MADHFLAGMNLFAFHLISHLIMSKESDNCYVSICLRQVAKGHKLLPGCYVNSINVKISTTSGFFYQKACMGRCDMLKRFPE